MLYAACPSSMGAAIAVPAAKVKHAKRTEGQIWRRMSGSRRLLGALLDHSRLAGLTRPGSSESLILLGVNREQGGPFFWQATCGSLTKLGPSLESVDGARDENASHFAHALGFGGVCFACLWQLVFQSGLEYQPACRFGAEPDAG